MPYTSRQRRYFHHLAENPDDARAADVSPRTAADLASEADDLARAGRERKPVKKQTIKSFLDLAPLFGRPDA